MDEGFVGKDVAAGMFQVDNGGRANGGHVVLDPFMDAGTAPSTAKPVENSTQTTSEPHSTFRGLMLMDKDHTASKKKDQVPESGHAVSEPTLKFLDLDENKPSKPAKETKASTPTQVKESQGGIPGLFEMDAGQARSPEDKK